MMPCDANTVEYFNTIAWEIIHDKFQFPVMDAFWLSLSRPGHRQILHNNLIGPNLAHSGPEVYSVLMRKWVMMIMETICPDS
jgi:hypothetical protein